MELPVVVGNTTLVCLMLLPDAYPGDWSHRLRKFECRLRTSLVHWCLGNSVRASGAVIGAELVIYNQHQLALSLRTPRSQACADTPSQVAMTVGSPPR
jgi:hypothetical protein